MASFTLTSSVFPVGTSVGAYPAGDKPPSGAPSVSATESQTVAANGSASFVALAASTRYFFGASLSGTWHYVAGETPADSESVVAQTLIDAKGDLVAGTAADTAARLAVGTNGYVLAADSAETTGLKWVNPAALATTKGDIFVATASGTLARLPVGTNGQVLTADSTQSTGVKWA